jgi:hypothetical protein
MDFNGNTTPAPTTALTVVRPEEAGILDRIRSFAREHPRLTKAAISGAEMLILATPAGRLVRIAGVGVGEYAEDWLLSETGGSPTKAQIEMVRQAATEGVFPIDEKTGQPYIPQAVTPAMQQWLTKIAGKPVDVRKHVTELLSGSRGTADAAKTQTASLLLQLGRMIYFRDERGGYSQPSLVAVITLVITLKALLSLSLSDLLAAAEHAYATMAREMGL